MNYTYHFCDFTDSPVSVEATNHQINQTYKLQVCLDDRQLIDTNAKEISPLVADLVDIAASVYIADWLSPRKYPIPYQIHISLPLRHPEIFNHASVITCLQDLLQWYTKDHWYFDFKPRLRPPRSAESSRKFSLLYTNHSVEVALWSGGLDSLAGLYNRLAEETSAQYTLVGTGSNTSIQGKQRKIAEVVKENFLHRIRLIQIPIQIYYVNSQQPPTNDLFRARGFVFKLLGSVCAHLEGQQTLHIYENGFGAINLPYTLSEVGLAHTRSVHPISLLKMNNFVSRLLNVPFTFSNPFLFWTKAQMCEVLAKAKATSLAFETVTCDGRHRQAGQPSQCGYCSSCLLRRLALAVAQIEDRTEYVVTHGTKPSDSSRSLHFRVMQGQVKILQSILNSENPWQNLIQRYDDLRRIVSCLAKQEDTQPQIIQHKLLQLYRRHVEEWVRFENVIDWELSDNREVVDKQLSMVW